MQEPGSSRAAIQVILRDFLFWGRWGAPPIPNSLQLFQVSGPKRLAAPQCGKACLTGQAPLLISARGYASRFQDESYLS